MKIGVLALQGGVLEHINAITALGHTAHEVRNTDDLNGITHLILPGGESTTMRKLMAENGLWGAIQERIQTGDMAIFGTCAGAIFLCEMGLPATIQRNGYGAQGASCEVTLDSKIGPIQALFIRAPRFTNAGGCTVIATRNGEPVIIQQERILAVTCHPELTNDRALHAHFLSL